MFPMKCLLTVQSSLQLLILDGKYLEYVMIISTLARFPIEEGMKPVECRQAYNITQLKQNKTKNIVGIDNQNGNGYGSPRMCSPSVYALH